MSEIMSIYFLGICAFLLLALVLTNVLVFKKKIGELRKKIIGNIMLLCWIVSGFGLFFYTMEYLCNFTPNGVHLVQNVGLPSYQDDLMVVSFSDVNRALKIDLYGIKNFSPCCTQEKSGCGCVETYTSFFTLKTSAWKVPCPGGFLPVEVTCRQEE